jgi:hypothetical protein
MLPLKEHAKEEQLKPQTQDSGKDPASAGSFFI